MKLPFRSFTLLPKSFLGVDIGTSAVKIAEVKRWGERKSLKNYAELQGSALYDKPFRTFERSTLVLSKQDIARVIKAMLQEANIQTKDALFSLPDFSSFFTHFELPPMTREELPEAVAFEARRHVPLPLSEVTFDWQLLEGNFEQKTPLKILMVAVPKEIVNQYQEIANLAGLTLSGLEAEVFCIIRSCVNAEDKSSLALLDIGAQSTTVNIIAKRALRVSHSVDVAGNSLTDRIAKSLSVDANMADRYKFEKGMTDKNLALILSPMVDILLSELERVSREVQQQGGKEVERIVLAGGTALLPGLLEYVGTTAGKPTFIANPFENLYYPPVLEQTLKNLGPSFAVAIGAALRGLE
ncbi:MAG: type IV pilus assembly protein PilM [bacterium]|nr:type IV pilus assembly protein PilM [bacterium]